MAYDEELAERIRRLIGDRPDLTEKKMFGGLAFLIGATWHSVVSASGLADQTDRAQHVLRDASGHPRP